MQAGNTVCAFRGVHSECGPCSDDLPSLPPLPTAMGMLFMEEFWWGLELGVQGKPGLSEFCVSARVFPSLDPMSSVFFSFGSASSSGTRRKERPLEMEMFALRCVLLPVFTYESLPP